MIELAKAVSPLVPRSATALHDASRPSAQQQRNHLAQLMGQFRASCRRAWEAKVGTNFPFVTRDVCDCLVEFDRTGPSTDERRAADGGEGADVSLEVMELTRLDFGKSSYQRMLEKMRLAVCEALKES